ncbi:hypothetical protein F2P58_23330 [Vibrio fortis]|uniref:Uncharacterized protein n=1 Tax=Vibrio fortis TaxID=212667 RepID=A0A5N3QTG1_9VIBR|nr:hypothetical protein [Vibrio fortis]KAB0285449.1 hypothetical protein F2P58_23330 [Vibrio fortis]
MKVSVILERLLKVVVSALVNEAAKEVNKALKDENAALELDAKAREKRERGERRVNEAARVESLANKIKELV